ncbi:unnamed protein product, partial [Mesorhabditis spiculigera]
MDFYLSATPEERIFLCGYNRVRRYGTTQRVSHSKPPQLIEHTIRPEDTIAGLALRYNSSITDIKRINKLWSNESLFLKSRITIPVHCDTPISPPTVNLVPESPRKISKKQPGRDEPPPKGTQPEQSMRDILNRIDTSIKKSSKTVSKLEKESR